MPSILVIDDEPSITRLVRAVLSREGYDIRSANSGADALLMLDGWRPDLIILDLLMPEMDGRNFHLESRIAGYEGPFLILSAFGARIAQSDLDAAGSLEKPFDPADLIMLVARILSSCPSPQ